MEAEKHRLVAALRLEVWDGRIMESFGLEMTAQFIKSDC